jgi:hypothetical protein
MEHETPFELAFPAHAGHAFRHARRAHRSQIALTLAREEEVRKISHGAAKQTRRTATSVTERNPARQTAPLRPRPDADHSVSRSRPSKSSPARCRRPARLPSGPLRVLSAANRHTEKPFSPRARRSASDAYQLKPRWPAASRHGSPQAARAARTSDFADSTAPGPGSRAGRSVCEWKRSGVANPLGLL